MSEVPTTRIEGDYTDATVFLPREEIEDDCYQQIQDMVNHPAFQNPVRVMPDTHWGSGAVIGFTMPLTNRVCPNTVGVDVGCGMYSVKLGSVSIDPTDTDDLLAVDEQVRESVPMGREVHSGAAYHMKNDFPWEVFSDNWATFSLTHLDDDISLGEYHPDDFTPDIEYFKNLCRKVHYDMNRAIASVGTLGGGNHFLEFGVSETGDLWLTVHSGSRGLGMAVAQYHQERAEQLRDIETARTALRELPDEYLSFVKFDLNEVSDNDLLTWLQGGMGESFVDYAALKEEYAETDDANLIEEIGNELKKAIPEHNGGDVDDLAYLDGEEAIEYYVDIAFAQLYASESRKVMASLAADALGAEIVEEIEAVHNYIDYTDGIIRKGATPARDGQRVIIPMNMADGTFIARGKGYDESNQSVCHGAGRVMSRTQAFEDLSEEEHAEMMGDTVATELPLDEAPLAYKDMELIRKMIEPMVEIEAHLDPILNMKAPE